MGGSVSTGKIGPKRTGSPRWRAPRVAKRKRMLNLFVTFRSTSKDTCRGGSKARRDFQSSGSPLVWRRRRIASGRGGAGAAQRRSGGKESRGASGSEGQGSCGFFGGRS